MIESLKKNETFQYQKLTPQEMAKKGILGRLIGPCADFINPTRNGRKYTEELWENVFKDPLIQEKIKNGVCFGELGHPTDRTETDMTKIAVSLREQPKKNDKGQLVAYFDILDTPNGRILKTLCDYGSTIGISSRGTGDVIEDESGNEMVDPNTYEFECWDVVLIPAVESARLQYVTESIGSEKPSLRKALTESLEKATEEERKVMEETLHTLKIDIEEDTKIGSTPEKDKNIDAKIVEEVKTPQQTIEKTEEATVSGSDDLIKSLQEALKAKVTLEAQVKSLQEQLAVNDIKVGKVNEELGKYKDAVARLSSAVADKKKLQEQVSTLEEQLKKKDDAILAQKQRISRLVESTKTEVAPKVLTEDVSAKDAEITKLNESLTKQKDTYESKIATLTESIESLKATTASKEAESGKKIERLEKLKESYKGLVNETISHYIKSKADVLGVDVVEIKNRLPESYSIEDIDSICEDLQSYELNISKLPFSIDRKVKVKVRESKNENLSVDKVVDDEVDSSLLNLAGINK